MDAQLYRKVLLNATLGYAYHKLILDSRGKASDYVFLEVNRAYERITGIKSKDLVNRKATEIFKGIEESQFNWIEFFGSVVGSRGQIQVEQYFEPLAQWHRLEVISHGKDEFITLLTDISKERTALTELNNFFDVNLDLLSIADTDGNFIRVNRAWEETLGYSKEDLEARKFFEFVHPDDLQGTLDSLQRLKQQDNIINFVNRYRSKNGSYRFIEWRSNPRGKYIYAAARDITERIISEQKLEKLVHISEEFLIDSTRTIDYQRITDFALFLSEAKVAIFNLYNSKTIETKAISGGSKELKKAFDILGSTLVGRIWTKDASHEYNPHGPQIAIHTDLKNLIGKAISSHIVNTLVRSLGLGQVVLAKVNSDNRVVADITLIMPSRVAFENTPQLELFVRQVALLFSSNSAHKSLLSSNQLMSNLMAQVPGVIYQFQRYSDGTFLFPFVSHGAKDLFGFEPHEIEADETLLFRLVHPDDYQNFIDSIELSYKTLNDWEYEGRIVLPKGVIKWLSGRARPQAQPDGSVIWYGYIADNTERNRMEQEFLKEKNFGHLVLNTMGQGLTVTNVDGELEYVNPQFANLFGVDPSELIGKRPKDIFLRKYHGILDQAREDRIKGRTTTYDIEIEHRSGKRIPIIVTGVPVFSDGLFTGSIATFTDISEQIKIQSELRRVNREKDKFFSIIAHDLRSPLSGFIGLTELLSTNISQMDAERVQEVTSSLRITAENLYTLLENLLEWSRLQRGLAKFSPKVLDVSELVDSVLELLEQSAKAKEQAIDIDITDLKSIRADEQMLRSLLRNLISNAIKFTPRKGHIIIKMKKVNDSSELSVTDSGIGIPKGMLQSLFDLTKQNSRKGTEGEESSGLGLLLCHEFVQLHNGTISVDSTEGKGSTFKVSLPII